MNFRVSPDQKAMLERAARLQQAGVTEFVMAAALREAEHVLADRSRFELTPERWAEFEAALERPAEVTPQLAAFLATPSVLEGQ